MADKPKHTLDGRVLTDADLAQIKMEIEAFDQIELCIPTFALSSLRSGPNCCPS
jgi:hypothetical protein